MELFLRERTIGQKGPLSWDGRVCGPSEGEGMLVAGGLEVDDLSEGHEERQLLPVYLRCDVRRNSEDHKKPHRAVEALGTIRS